jgi:hypothetical protein
MAGKFPPPTASVEAQCKGNVAVDDLSDLDFNFDEAGGDLATCCIM